MKVKLVKHVLILFTNILEACIEKSGGFFLKFSSNYMAIENPQKNWILAPFLYFLIYIDVAFWLKKAACKLFGAGPRRRGREKNKEL
jgi:hypothetical protein